MPNGGTRTRIAVESCNEGTLLFASIPELPVGIEPTFVLYKSTVLAAELRKQLSTSEDVDVF